MLFCSVVIAQPDNYKFYPHDYAKSTFDESEQPIKSPESEDGKSNLFDKSKTGPASKVGADLQAQSVFEPAGAKIEGLSLVVSGLDLDKLMTQVTTMIDIFNRKSVQPGRIYIIGRSATKHPKALKDMIQRVSMLAGEVLVGAEPPTNFKITKVPTWILSLKEGDVVLEGLDSPDRFINSKAEFIEPQSSIELEAE